MTLQWGMGGWENIMGVAGQAGTLSCPDMVKSLIPLEEKVHINPPISKLHWSWCFDYSNRKETLKLFRFHQGSLKAGGAGGKARVGSTEKTPGGEAFVQAGFSAGGLLVQ